MNDREAMAQDLHDNAPQGLIDFLDMHDITADVWFLNYAEALNGWTRQRGVSVEAIEDLLQPKIKHFHHIAEMFPRGYDSWTQRAGEYQEALDGLRALARAPEKG
jgi:hypothetical protein